MEEFWFVLKEPSVYVDYLQGSSFTVFPWFSAVVLMGMMYTWAVRIVRRGQNHLIHHLLMGDTGCQIYHLFPKWRIGMHVASSLRNHKHDSVTSAVTLPKFTVGHCVDVVAVNVYHL